MNLKPYTRIVTHVDFYRRPLDVVRNELWDATANHLAEEIFAKGYSGKEAVPFIRAAWPEMAYSILEKSPSFEYSKEQFLAMTFFYQQQWTGQTYGLLRLMNTVESKMKMMNYAAQVSGSEGVVV